MYDYSLNDEQREKYILDYEKGESRDLIVHFADTNQKKGISFYNILNSKENIDKLDKKMECQMSDAIQNKKKFVLNKKESLKNTFYSIAGVGLSFAGANIDYNNGKVLGTVCLGVIGGLVTIFGISSYRNYLKEKRKVNEIEKAEYIKDNKKKLDSISSYPNSLVGLSDEVSKFIKDSDDPFKVNNYDLFNKCDLERIVLNIEREEEFGFQYVNK